MKKIGIFAWGQQGDILEASCVLYHAKELWGDNVKIIWFINQERNYDLFKHNPMVEVRKFPHGEGYPERCLPNSQDNINSREKGLPLWEDWSILKTTGNRLHQENKLLFESTKDLDDGYFPCPHQMSPEQRHGLEYSNCSKVVFGVTMEREWHPVIKWSEEDVSDIFKFANHLPFKNTILFETFAGSAQSRLSHKDVMTAIDLCRMKYGKCNFIFASHKYLNGQEAFPEGFFEMEGVVSAAHFTVRQCALLNDYCDLMIGVSSGISVATSAWSLKSTSKLQYCGSKICSTLAIANGRIDLIETDFIAEPSILFEQGLKKILAEI